MEWSIATTQLPIYVYELGASALEVSLVFAVFAGIMIFSLPSWGYLSDRLKKRKTFMVSGMMGLGLMFITMSTTTNVTTLILLRGSTALFVGAIVPATWALVSELATDETVGHRMGVLNSSEMAGFGVGPVVGGIIADYFGFTCLWIFVAAVSFAGALVFLVFGFDLAADSRQPALFIGTRKKRSATSFLILYAIFSIFLLGVAVLGPNRNVYLVEELKMSRTMFGFLESIGTLSSTAVQPFLGSFSDRRGRRPVMILAALSLVAGLAALYVARDFLQAIPSAILMANYSSFQMAAAAYISDNLKREERGSSLGFLNSLGSASRSLGAILGGLLILETSIHTAILLSMIFPAISIVLTILVLEE
jgi:MFS family permease